jgi:hypothetical protein
MTVPPARPPRRGTSAGSSPESHHQWASARRDGLKATPGTRRSGRAGSAGRQSVRHQVGAAVEAEHLVAAIARQEHLAAVVRCSPGQRLLPEVAPCGGGDAPPLDVAQPAGDEPAARPDFEAGAVEPERADDVVDELGFVYRRPGREAGRVAADPCRLGERRDRGRVDAAAQQEGGPGFGGDPAPDGGGDGVADLVSGLAGLGRGGLPIDGPPVPVLLDRTVPASQQAGRADPPDPFEQGAAVVDGPPGQPLGDRGGVQSGAGREDAEQDVDLGRQIRPAAGSCPEQASGAEPVVGCHEPTAVPHQRGELPVDTAQEPLPLGSPPGQHDLDRVDRAGRRRVVDDPVDQADQLAVPDRRGGRGDREPSVADEVRQPRQAGEPIRFDVDERRKGRHPERTSPVTSSSPRSTREAISPRRSEAIVSVD